MFIKKNPQQQRKMGRLATDIKQSFVTCTENRFFFMDGIYEEVLKMHFDLETLTHDCVRTSFQNQSESFYFYNKKKKNFAKM